MNRLSSLLIPLAVVGVLTLGFSSTAQADEPWWFDPNKCSACYLTGDCDGMVCDWACNYDACVDPPGPCPDMVAASSVEMVGNTVTLIIGNYHINKNKKHMFIRVEGTGAEGDPVMTGFVPFINAPQPFPKHKIMSERAGNDEGSWWIEIEAWVIPQPDKVTVTIDVPGTAPVLVKTWIWECCTEFERQDTFSVDSAMLIPENSPVDGWYYYENTGWWNIWFWNDPYVDTWKAIKVEFTLAADPPPTGLEVAVNWSTPVWSEDDPPGEPPLPPLSPAEEGMYIMREQLLEPPPVPGPNAYVVIIDDYNPEWVSIDVRSPAPFVITDGKIYHECMPLGWPIPTVSAWGLLVMTLLVLSAGTIVFRRFRAAAA